MEEEIKNVGNSALTGSGATAPKQSKKGMSFQKMMMLVLVVLLLATAGAAYYYYQQNKDARANPSDAVASKNAEETTRVLTALGNVLTVDTSTEPTVARVENPDLLREANPDFYKDVAVDDYLVIYPNRAIIFRLSESKVINVAPIINNTQIQEQSQEATTPAEGTNGNTTN